MGNIAAIDVGIVILRLAIFDRKNNLYPYSIQKKLHEKDPKARVYFMNDLSFYSMEHGGTFHFLQFNILHAKSVNNLMDSSL